MNVGARIRMGDMCRRYSCRDSDTCVLEYSLLSSKDSMDSVESPDATASRESMESMESTSMDSRDSMLWD